MKEHRRAFERKAMHKNCYGEMFPHTAELEGDQGAQGKVFSFRVIKKGLAIPEKPVSFEMGEWDDCLACEEHDSCYRLSMGKMILRNALG